MHIRVTIFTATGLPHDPSTVTTVEPRERLSRGRVVTIAILVAWFVAVLFWALQPVDDSVPTGIVNNQQTAQAVHCDAPLSGNDGPTAPLPSLPPGRAYARTACTDMYTQYRTLFWIEPGLVFVLLALLLTVRQLPQEVGHEQDLEDSYLPAVLLGDVVDDTYAD